MEIVSKTYDKPVWGDNQKTHILVNIKTKMDDGQIMIQSAAITRDNNNPDWAAIIEEHGEKGVEANTKNMLKDQKENIVKHTAKQKEEQVFKKERTAQERLFDSKLAIFEIEDIKNSKNRKIKSKIRKAPTEIEAMAYATALLLNVINETEKE
jgi:hypothetical protein